MLMRSWIYLLSTGILLMMNIILNLGGRLMQIAKNNIEHQNGDHHDDDGFVSDDVQ